MGYLYKRSDDSDEECCDDRLAFIAEGTHKLSDSEDGMPRSLAKRRFTVSALFFTTSFLLGFGFRSELGLWNSKSSGSRRTTIDNAVYAALLDDSPTARTKNFTGPAIVWLMSFPNSGTSYTMGMISHLTKTRKASNYGPEGGGYSRESMPIFNDQPGGPFWLYEGYEHDLPTEFIMTKTHCGGRCEFCSPTKYVETSYSFRHQCLSGTRVKVNVNGTAQVETVSYPPDRVRKAIHLIRDPYDNIVSRFHLQNKNGLPGVSAFPRTQEGFRDFCQFIDTPFIADELQAVFLDMEHLLQDMMSIPCHADFFRYVEWHNQAFITAQEMELETMVLNYDDYSKDLDTTVDRLLKFLQLEAKDGREPKTFVEGLVYRDYYTEEERRRIRAAVEWMASRATWANIARYFD